MSWTLAELARRVNGEVIGDPGREVDRLRPLESAGPRDLSFLGSARFAAAARASAAGAIVVGAGAPDLAADRIRVDDPAAAVAELSLLFHPAERPAPGVHPTAVVGAGAVIDGDAHVGPFVVVGETARIGAGAVLHAHAVVGRGAAVGARTVLHPHAVLYPGVELGDDVEVHAGVVIGADGFGYASSRLGHRKIPQVGSVVVGDRVEIGALSAIDRGTLADTTIGSGTKIDNLVQVGHNVQVGQHALLCGQSGIAGSAKLGDFVVLAGQSGVGDHVTVGPGTQIAAKSAVLQNEAGGRKVAGIPAVELGEWKRRQAIERRLGEIWRTVQRLARGRGDKDKRGGEPPEGER